MLRYIAFIICIFQFSCSINTLRDKELCDTFAISDNAMLIITCYKFSKSSYSIYMMEHFGGHSPYPNHLVEEGSYAIHKDKVKLVPRVKLLSKILNTDIYVPSRKLMTFDSVALILRDTLTFEKINELNFNERICTMTKVNETIILSDPQIQILRYKESPFRKK